MKWGILGCGELAEKKIAPAMQAAKNTELVAVMRRTGAAVERFARDFGVARWYDNVEALLSDEQIEAVYISSPVAAHAPLTVLAAQHGKHVICEKPMAISAPGAEEMLAACEEHGVRLSIAYYRRYYPKMQAIRKLIAEGAIGNPLSAYIQFHDAIDAEVIAQKPWIVQRSIAGGGAGMDVGCHMADLVCYCLGQEAVAVSAFTEPLPGTDVESSMNMLLHLSHGCKATVSAAFGAPKQTPFCIYGSAGSIVMDSVDDDLFRLNRAGSTPETISCPHGDNMYVPIIEAFTESVRAGTKTISEGKDCLHTSRLLAEAYLAAETGTVRYLSRE